MKMVTFPDMAMANLREEITSLRGVIRRLEDHDEISKGKLSLMETNIKEKDAKISELVNWKTEHLNYSLNLEIELKNAKIRETKARVTKEFLSVQLSLLNIDNAAHIKHMNALEKEIEGKNASEAEKLTMLLRLNKALDILWKREREARNPKACSGIEAKRKIEEILLEDETNLETKNPKECSGIEVDRKIEEILLEDDANLETPSDEEEELR